MPLQEMPLNENLQKSGDNHKIERHNSFALYGKRNGTMNNTKQQSGFNGLKRDQNGDTLLPREPNETTIMKARPSTSFRVANKNYNSQNSSSSNFKFQRQVFQNKTNENSSMKSSHVSQTRESKSLVDKENCSSVSGIVSKENVFANCTNNA